MDTLDAIEKLAQQARREKTPTFHIADRIIKRAVEPSRYFAHFSWAEGPSGDQAGDDDLAPRRATLGRGNYKNIVIAKLKLIPNAGRRQRAFVSGGPLWQIHRRSSNSMLKYRLG